MTTEHKKLYTADLNFTTYSASKENNPESEAVPTLTMQNWKNVRMPINHLNNNAAEKRNSITRAFGAELNSHQVYK